ncbi:tyrosine-protein phosphatase [Xenorhabdus szentirmaii]|uniref:Tyrosine-protein phosphatase n=1 Tax=Xenorhabdus szentirmaii TaxID=290112 RepID=A0AAW3YN83_9GAMM|nr:MULTISPECIES: tyrosine-protein phosphatase [unclassified Xenorhabdus]MBD2791980.1 tyrosine-protein phosphatase [Xenorhabdus sp. CUL]MBD2799490.1 tyrosine-protein phosphatase [Xenorhabdus sp. M]MBD2806157.1 tyrosine-protein phosphatase [Xenorhabdus sp. ZM]
MKKPLNNLNRLNIYPIHHADILNGRILKIKHTSTISHGMLIRCGIQKGKEKATYSQLSGILPINTWIDLRTPEEYEPQFNSHIPTSIQYINYPIRFKPPKNNQTRIVTESDYINLYFTMSHVAWDIAYKIKNLLKTGNVMLHCSLGKDRTGLVTAAILHQLQFSTLEIAHDFALSARFLRRQYQLIENKANINGVPKHLQARRYELSKGTIIPILHEWTKIISCGGNTYDQ